MKSRKIVGLLVRLTLPFGAVLLIWNPLVRTTFELLEGPDRRYDMGDSYEIWGPIRPNLVYMSLEEKVLKKIIEPEPIVEFALTGTWLIGRTEKGWFAINKKTHQLYYPHSSKDELQAVTSLDVSSLHFMTDPSPYQIVYPRTKKAVRNINRLCWFLVFALPVTLGFGPYVWRRFIPRSKKL